MTFADFEAAFGKYPEYSKIEEKNRRFLHEYVVAKVKQKYAACPVHNIAAAPQSDRV
jgi:hypothetical protein